jgi:hypothetical protein
LVAGCCFGPSFVYLLFVGQSIVRASGDIYLVYIRANLARHQTAMLTSYHWLHNQVYQKEVQLYVAVLVIFALFRHDFTPILQIIS